MGTRRTPEQRLAELERKRARLASQVRTAATREKIVIGAAVASEARACADFAATLKAILLCRITRDSDKSAVAAFLENLPGDPALETTNQTAEPLAIPPTTTEAETAIPASDPLAALDGLSARRNRI